MPPNDKSSLIFLEALPCEASILVFNEKNKSDYQLFIS